MLRPVAFTLRAIPGRAPGCWGFSVARRKQKTLKIHGCFLALWGGAISCFQFFFVPACVLRVSCVFVACVLRVCCVYIACAAYELLVCCLCVACMLHARCVCVVRVCGRAYVVSTYHMLRNPCTCMHGLSFEINQQLSLLLLTHTTSPSNAFKTRNLMHPVCMYVCMHLYMCVGIYVYVDTHSL